MMQYLEVGAAVRLSINGIIVGFATGLSFSRTINTKEIYGIDDPLPKEIMPTTYSVRGTMTGIRVRDSGGLDGYGIMNLSTIAQYFDFKYATIEVVNILSNKTIYTFQKVVFDTDSWNISAKERITFSANFKGMFVTNENSK